MGPMWGISFFSIFCFCFSFILFCKTQPKEEAISAKRESRGNWSQIIKEGWVDNDTLQAYKRSWYSESIEEHVMKVRERLVWLLLVESYKVTQEDMHIAKRLAKSQLLANLGEEKVFHKVENGKIYILLQKKGRNIKEEWKYALLKIEDKISQLKELRKGW